jgi:hypothetical protein
MSSWFAKTRSCRRHLGAELSCRLCATCQNRVIETGLVPCAFGGSPLSRWEKQEPPSQSEPADAHAADAQGLPANPVRLRRLSHRPLLLPN